MVNWNESTKRQERRERVRKIKELEDLCKPGISAATQGILDMTEKLSVLREELEPDSLDHVSLDMMLYQTSLIVNMARQVSCLLQEELER